MCPLRYPATHSVVVCHPENSSGHFLEVMVSVTMTGLRFCGLTEWFATDSLRFFDEEGQLTVSFL